MKKSKIVIECSVVCADKPVCDILVKVDKSNRNGYV
jgi:hypothetical protein